MTTLENWSRLSLIDNHNNHDLSPMIYGGVAGALVGGFLPNVLQNNSLIIATIVGLATTFGGMITGMHVRYLQQLARRKVLRLVVDNSI